MPLFEFRCKSCSKKFTALVGVISESKTPACPACGSSDLTKLVSRFSRTRSDEDMLEQISDPSRVGDLDDPDNMRKFVKEMGKELGEDLGDEFDEYLEEAKAGDLSEDTDEAIY